MDAFADSRRGASASPRRIAAAIFSVANFMLRYWRLYCQDKPGGWVRAREILSGGAVVVVCHSALGLSGVCGGRSRSRYLHVLHVYRSVHDVPVHIDLHVGAGRTNINNNLTCAFDLQM